MIYINRLFIKFFCGFLGYCLLGCIILFLLPEVLKTDYYIESLVIASSYFIVGGLLFWTVFKYKINIFEPFILISILYLCLFTFTPLIFIFKNKTDVYGVDVMGGATKATIIYIISYFSFTLGYVRNRFKSINLNPSIIYKVSQLKKQKITIVCFLIWIFCFASGLLYLLSIGRNITQIFTFGISGNNNIAEVGSIMKFLMNFSYGMIIPCVFMLFYSKNYFVNCMILYCTLAIYFSNGFRYIIIILLISIVITFYRKRCKLPSIKMIVLGISTLLIFIGLLGFVRNDLRTGKEIQISSFNIDDILYALESNFDIYKTFYGIVETYPYEYDYTYGKAMIVETVEMFIPRALWANKTSAINSSIVLAIRRSTSDFAITNAAMATPNIGEFYVDFGILGCVVFMYLLGLMANWTTRFYYISNNNLEYIILYSVIMPTFMQLVIRGYTPSNFYLLLFLFAPFLLIKLLVHKVKF